jgi:hypothetical protein
MALMGLDPLTAAKWMNAVLFAGKRLPPPHPRAQR